MEPVPVEARQQGGGMGRRRTTEVATIKDVAARAGVGIGTVSRVLNKSGPVAEATRRRVELAIAEVGYRPSQLARKFSRGATRSIGVVLPYMTRPSVVERLRGIVTVLAANSFDTVVYNVESEAQLRHHLDTLSRRHLVDGLVFISLAIDRLWLQKMSENCPVVLVDRYVEGFDSITIDDVAGGRLATEYLATLGHRRIGFIGDEPEGDLKFTSSRDRQTGWEEVMARAEGVSLETLKSVAPHGTAEAEKCALNLLTSHSPPTAIFAASDTQALGVLRAASKLERSVPRELSVLGFDDVQLAGLIGLSTVRQPLEQSGKLAAEHLVVKLSGGRRQGRVENAIWATTLPLSIVERSTTAALT